MAGTRIDDHVRPLPVVDGGAFGRQDPEQHVVGRALEVLAVDHGFIIINENRRMTLGSVFVVDIAALAKGVEGENRALPGIDGIGDERAIQIGTIGFVRHIAGDLGHRLGCIAKPRSVGFGDPSEML